MLGKSDRVRIVTGIGQIIIAILVINGEYGIPPIGQPPVIVTDIAAEYVHHTDLEITEKLVLDAKIVTILFIIVFNKETLISVIIRA